MLDPFNFFVTVGNFDICIEKKVTATTMFWLGPFRAKNVKNDEKWISKPYFFQSHRKLKNVKLMGEKLPKPYNCVVTVGIFDIYFQI